VVPSTLSDRSIFSFFGGWKWLDNPHGLVILDFRTANFLSPWIVTQFAAWALHVKERRGRRIDLKIDPRSVAGSFLARAGFPELLGSTGYPAEANLEQRIVKLTRVRTASDIAGVSSRIMEVLRIEDEEVGGAIKYSLIELLRNVVQHANSPTGGLAMAQYFPSTGLVEVVVADLGIGIRSSLTARYPEIDTDYKALRVAMQPHISGTFRAGGYASMSDNAGLGLFFIKEISSLSKGGFFLGSGRALANVWGDEAGLPHKKFKDASAGGWPGTFAVLLLKTDTIAEFDAVLRVCRELAAKARDYPAEQWLDFVDEIPEIEGLTIIPVQSFEENVEEAARVRDRVIAPQLDAGGLVVLDFANVPFATQSFIHALMYKLLRDARNLKTGLTIARSSESTREAIHSVAAYARLGDDPVLPN
jgi:hypothetical protein